MSENYLKNEVGQTRKSNAVYKCEFCSLSFRKESTLYAHMCEQKRRYKQRKERGVQLGYFAYKRFYELEMNNKMPPSYEDFSKSKLYLDFVKFGRYVKMSSILKPNRFIDYLIKNNKKLNKWCDDKVYNDYLIDTLRKENPNDTLERAFTAMIDWSEKHENFEWNDYFRKAGTPLICEDIKNGSISPWIVYNCESGIKRLSEFNDHDISMVYDIINPDFWTQKFSNYITDVEYIRGMLKDAYL